MQPGGLCLINRVRPISAADFRRTRYQGPRAGQPTAKTTVTVTEICAVPALIGTAAAEDAAPAA